MSVYPTTEEVHAFREKLARLRVVTQEMRDTEAERLACVARLQEYADEEPRLRRELMTLMTSMDAVTTRGNFGWEARTLAFLLELDRQADAAGKVAGFEHAKSASGGKA